MHVARVRAPDDRVLARRRAGGRDHPLPGSGAIDGAVGDATPGLVGGDGNVGGLRAREGTKPRRIALAVEVVVEGGGAVLTRILRDVGAGFHAKCRLANARPDPDLR